MTTPYHPTDIEDLCDALDKAGDFILLAQRIHNDAGDGTALDQYDALVRKSKEFYPVQSLTLAKSQLSIEPTNP